eukprot:570191-Lingulodinium_polyedra.AAC.1
MAATRRRRSPFLTLARNASLSAAPTRRTCRMLRMAGMLSTPTCTPPWCNIARATPRISVR